jgi:hypothetical protein
MNESTVTVVRIYLHEAKSHQEKLLRYLHDESRIRGVTVFRGVTGFGMAGKYHTSTLLDLSLDLPVVIEFFDEPEKVRKIIEHLNSFIKPGHMIYWSAQVNKLNGPEADA